MRTRPPPVGLRHHKGATRAEGEGDAVFGVDAEQQARAFDSWSAHVRYFLAQYPLETRHFVAQVRDMEVVSALLASSCAV